jgi:hypothetical protein
MIPQAIEAKGSCITSGMTVMARRTAAGSLHAIERKTHPNLVHSQRTVYHTFHQASFPAKLSALTPKVNCTVPTQSIKMLHGLIMLGSSGQNFPCKDKSIR